MTLAQDIIDRQTSLAATRLPWERVWADVAPFVDPMNEEWGAIGEQSFDSKPREAVVRFASTGQSFIIPRAQKWHGLKPIEEKLVDDRQVKRFSDEVLKKLFSWRYDPKSGFQSSMNASFLSLGQYGIHCVYSEEQFGGDVPIRYQFIPVQENFPALNSVGQVDENHRRYMQTAKQLAEYFNKPGDKLPDKILNAANDPQKKSDYFEVIHGVLPSFSDKGRFGFESIYVSVDDKQLIRKSGFHEFPYFFSSFGSVDNKTPYSYCPAIDALPSMRGASHALRLMLRAAEKAIDPSIATHEELETIVELNAGQFIPGLIDKNGQQLFQPIVSGSRPDIGKEMLDFMHDAANGSFYGDLLLAIAGQNKAMTAQEALLLKQEQSAIVDPFFGNQEIMLANMIARDMAIIFRKAQTGEVELPDIPEQLMRSGGLDLEWNSPLSQLRKSGEASNTLQFVGAVGQLAEVNPEVIDRVNFDEAAEVIGDALGISGKVMRTDDEVAGVRSARQQQQQIANQREEEALAAQNARNVAPLVKAMGEQ